MSQITNPHDAFFKEILSREEHARDFLHHYLPGHVSSMLDLASLHICKDSFVDKDLREYFSDLLYQVNIRGESGFIYLLFEHKSYPEKYISIFLLRNMTKLWELYLKRGAIPAHGFPVIIPLVVYHGKRQWNIGQSLSSLFAVSDESLNIYLPDFRYELCDLSRIKDEEIKGVITLRAALLLLKYIFHPELRDKLAEVLKLLGKLSYKKTGLEYLETMLKYVVNATDRITDEDLRKIVMETLPEGGKLMPTIAQKWLEEGIQQGIHEGALKNARKSMLDVLEARFDMVPLDIIKTIQGIDEIVMLESLLKKTIKVHSLDEFRNILKESLH